MEDCLCLEPSTSLSKFIGNNSDTIKIRVILIDLVVRISPSISYSYTFKNYLCLIQKCFVVDYPLSKGRNIVSCKGLSSNVQRTLLKSRPLFVEIIQKVEQMFTSLPSWTNQSFSFVFWIWKSNSNWLINEDSMPDDIPRISNLTYLIFSDLNGSIFSKSTKLRTCTWTSLQPKNKRNTRVSLNWIMSIGSKHIIKHAWLASCIVPIDFFIS